MTELGALFLAGLAFFFTGLAGVRTNLQQLSTRRFRIILARATNSPVLSCLAGSIFGAVTQSASAVAFIVAGMVTTGLVQLRQALPVVAASNMGTALLVFLAAADLRVGVLYLIGLTGLAIAFDVGGSRVRPGMSALFAIGLLFYGLNLMKAAFAPLPQYAAFKDLAGFLAGFSLAPFLFGMALRVLIQSSAAISVIAITLMAGGLFNEFQASMLIAGSGPGVGLAAFLLSSNLSGVPRQIVLYQAITNSVSGLIVGTLLWLEYQLHTFGIQAFAHVTAAEADSRLALIYLIMMSGSFLLGIGSLPFIRPLLARLAPTTVQEDMSKPAYLVDEAAEVPETAFELAGKEQERLLGFLPLYLQQLLPEAERKPAPSPATLHTAIQSLHLEIESFLHHVGRIAQRDIDAEHLLQMERREESISMLETTLHQFAGSVPNLESAPGGLVTLLSRMAEALQTILLTLQDAVVAADVTDLEYLLQMTEDRGNLMERLRRSYLEDPDLQAFPDRSALYHATTLFERIVWQIHQIGLVLSKAQKIAT